MSIITLEKAKQYLDVIHTGDDDKIQDLLDGAEDEALRFMNRSHFSGTCPPCWGDPLVDVADPDVMNAGQRTAVLLLLEADYGATPDDADKLRLAARIKLRGHRCSGGL